MHTHYAHQQFKRSFIINKFLIGLEVAQFLGIALTLFLDELYFTRVDLFDSDIADNRQRQGVLVRHCCFSHLYLAHYYQRFIAKTFNGNLLQACDFNIARNDAENLASIDALTGLNNRCTFL